MRGKLEERIRRRDDEGCGDTDRPVVLRQIDVEPKAPVGQPPKSFEKKPLRGFQPAAVSASMTGCFTSSVVNE